MMGADGFECGKDEESVALTIRQRLEAGTMGAKGDNCDGWASVESEDPQ